MLESVVKQQSELLSLARKAKINAFDPYSNFAVGAAVRTPDGRVFVGSNIENASYGLSMCAERVAIFSAIAAGARNISELAVSAGDRRKQPKQTQRRMPCGACLQVLAEFASTESQLLVDRVGVFTLSQLLPRPFSLGLKPAAGHDTKKR